MEAIHEQVKEKSKNTGKSCIDQLSQLIQVAQEELPRMETKNPNTLSKELLV